MELIERGQLVIKMVGQISHKKNVTWGYVGNVFTVDAEHHGNWARFIRHSCKPNLIAITLVTTEGLPEVHLYSLRPLIRHEELTFCYTLMPHNLVHFDFHAEAKMLMQ